MKNVEEILKALSRVEWFLVETNSKSIKIHPLLQDIKKRKMTVYSNKGCIVSCNISKLHKTVGLNIIQTPLTDCVVFIIANDHSQLLPKNPLLSEITTSVIQNVRRGNSHAKVASLLYKML